MSEANSKAEKGKDILHRLITSAKICQTQYGGRKELASEKDDKVARLCDCIEEALTYGLKTSSATLLQNVQEMVNIGVSASSNEYNFWGFCQRQLTAHERERFENLNHVWTKCGKAKAFIRSMLNEKSLGRYILMYLSDTALNEYYDRWSLLRDPEAVNLLPSIASGLNSILFALTIDSPDINVNSSKTIVPPKGEPVIYAPTPIGPTKKISAIVRPIACTPDLNEFVKPIPTPVIDTPAPIATVIENPISSYESSREYPTFPALSEFSEDNTENASTSSGIQEQEEHADDYNSSSSQELDNKSECSSAFSKSSSNTSAKFAASKNILEEKLREMNERCSLLETRVAQLSLENRQLRRVTNYTNRSPGSSNCLITIPFAKLIKHGHKKHYTYEIHITMVSTLEKWTISRRYREFYRLNESLKQANACLNHISFPPKKRFGNMNILFVEERRQLLQIYLRDLMETLPQVESCKTKDELQLTFPFFRE